MHAFDYWIVPGFPSSLAYSYVHTQAQDIQINTGIRSEQGWDKSTLTSAIKSTKNPSTYDLQKYKNRNTHNSGLAMSPRALYCHTFALQAW